MAGLVGQTGLFSGDRRLRELNLLGDGPAAQPAHSLGALPPNSGECTEGQAQRAGREEAVPDGYSVNHWPRPN
jgi:hypothetical protein